MYYPQQQQGYPYYQQYPQQQQYQYPQQQEQQQQQQQQQQQYQAYQQAQAQQAQPNPYEQASAPQQPEQPEQTPSQAQLQPQPQYPAQTPVQGQSGVVLQPAPAKAPVKHKECCKEEKCCCGISKKWCIIIWVIAGITAVVIALIITFVVLNPGLFKGPKTLCGCLNKDCHDECDQEDEDEQMCFKTCKEGQKCYTNTAPKDDDDDDDDDDNGNDNGVRHTHNILCNDKPGYYKCTGFGGCSCGKQSCDETVKDTCQGNCTPPNDSRRRRQRQKG